MYDTSRWLMPITITSSNNSFVIDETAGAGVVAVTVSAGTYWLHDDSSIHATYPGLYRAIKVALDASALTYAYTWSAQTPLDSTDQTNRGLRLTADTDNWTLDLANASFTMDNRWFGFAQGHADVASGIAAATVTSDLTIRGIWDEYSIVKGVQGRASKKRSRNVKKVRHSHDIADARAAQKSYEQTIREYLIEFVPAAHVLESRAAETGYATVGELDTADSHNAFETIWEELSEDGEIIVVQDVGNANFDLQVDAHDYSVVKTRDELADFFDSAKMTRMGGEFYSIGLELVDVAGTYGH